MDNKVMFLIALIVLQITCTGVLVVILIKTAPTLRATKSKRKPSATNGVGIPRPALKNKYYPHGIQPTAPLKDVSKPVGMKPSAKKEEVVEKMSRKEIRAEIERLQKELENEFAMSFVDKDNDKLIVKQSSEHVDHLYFTTPQAKGCCLSPLQIKALAKELSEYLQAVGH